MRKASALVFLVMLGALTLPALPVGAERKVFQEDGWAWWLSLLSTGPAAHRRATYHSRYAHSSVPTKIEPGLGNYLQAARILTLGTRINRSWFSLQGDISLAALAFVGVPGHREFTLAPLIMPGAVAVVEVHPFARLPLKLRGHGEIFYAPPGVTTSSGDEKEKEVSVNLLSTTAGLHLVWEVVRERVIGRPVFEVAVGANHMTQSGEFIPEKTFPGLTFESTQTMYGGRLTFTRPFWLGNKIMGRGSGKTGTAASRREQEQTVDWNFLVLGAGFYTGLEDGYMVTWTVDWLWGGSSTE
jgi:hypothetical protein